MDQVALVNEHIDDGRKLVDELIQQGIKVTAAAWLKTAQREGQWHLFIASPIANNDDGYWRVHAIFQNMPGPFWVEWLDIKLISPRSALAKRLLEIYQRYPAKDGIRYAPHIADAADLGIEDAFIYPIRPPVASPSAH